MFSVSLFRVGRELHAREVRFGEPIDFEAERVDELALWVVRQQPFGFFLNLGNYPLVPLDGDVADFLQSQLQGALSSAFLGGDCFGKLHKNILSTAICQHDGVCGAPGASEEVENDVAFIGEVINELTNVLGVLRVIENFLTVENLLEPLRRWGVPPIRCIVTLEE